MTSLEQLPVDAHEPLEHEHHVVDILLTAPQKQEPPSTPTDAKHNHHDDRDHHHHPYLRMFEESLTIVLLFLVFNLPIVDQLLENLHIRNVFLIYALKIFLIVIFFWILKTCLKING